MKFYDKVARERSIDGQIVRTQYRQRIVQVTPVRPDHVAVFVNQDGSEERRLIVALALVENDLGDTVTTSAEGMTLGDGCFAECVSDNGHFRGYEFVEGEPAADVLLRKGLGALAQQALGLLRGLTLVAARATGREPRR